jgi:hypothetical protein
MHIYFLFLFFLVLEIELRAVLHHLNHALSPLTFQIVSDTLLEAASDLHLLTSTPLK